MKSMYIIAAFLLVGLVGTVRAETYRGIPMGPDGQTVQTTNWGVQYATASAKASTNSVLLFDKTGVILGVIVSSNNSSTDFVLFRNTNTTVDMETGSANELFRVYLPTNTMGSADGTVGPTAVPRFGNYIRFNPPPVVRGGSSGRLVGNPVNSIMYLFQELTPD